jgi:hypothetical protein
VLVGGAVGLHFAIHVPRGEYEPRAPKAAPARSATPARAKPTDGGGFRARRAVRLRELRRQYRDVAFENEPVDEAFARAHEGVLTRAVSIAQAAAFAGAPEVPQLESEVGCATIRCKVDACSEFPPELDLFASGMQALRLDGEPLFHRVDVEPTTRGDLGKEPAGQPCYRLLVSFGHDLPNRSNIVAPDPDDPDDPGPERD